MTKKAETKREISQKKAAQFKEYAQDYLNNKKEIPTGFNVADEIAENLQKSFSKISNSIINIVSVSEETAASAEEVAAAAEEMTSTVEELSSAAQELNTQADESSKMIATFKIK